MFLAEGTPAYIRNLLAWVWRGAVVVGFGGAAAWAQDARQIVGYENVCSSKVSGTEGSLTGYLAIREDGERASFFAQLNAARAVGGLTDAKSLKRARVQSHAEWSLYWREDGPDVLIRFERGSLELDVSTDRRLPVQNVLMLGRESLAGTGLVSSARRWEGRQNGAAFRFPLSEVLGFVVTSRKAYWQLYPRSLPSDWVFATSQRRADGVFDLDLLKPAAFLFEKLQAELESQSAEHRSACKKTPIYHDPLAEI